MIYSSLLFIYGFFPVSLAVYHFTPKKLKDISLFLLSLIFCGFFSLEFLVFMLIYIAVNYTCARITYALKWQKSGCGGVSLVPFATGILFDILLIFAFRSSIFSWIYEPFNLPDGFFHVGISFFTLSACGYLIDVYKGRIKAEINFIRFGLFIMMFPRLWVCSVVSYDNFVRILKKRKIRMSELGAGMELFVKGLAKKVIIADSLFMLYSDIKSIETGNLACLTAWLGLIAYIFCLYFTLSGISDMGNGIACCFGFRFPNCFSYPVFSSRIRYFSVKWQVQTVQWFRKYVLQPLCAFINDKYAGMFISAGVPVLIGFWYKFSLNGIIWGLFIGLGIIIESRLRSMKMLKSTGIIYTFVVILILSVFLSCGSAGEALRYLWAMVGGNRLFADSLTAYFVRYYIIILLAAMYSSTDLFKNTVARLEKTRFRIIVSVLWQVSVVFLFVVCTALISYTGSSEMNLIKL